MNPIQLAIDLTKVSGRTLFLRCDPEILDYTDRKSKANLVLVSHDQEITVSLEPNKLISVLGVLREALTGLSLLAWNVKNLFTYVRHFTRTDFDPDCQFFDLKVVESYLGRHGTAPKTLLEAVNRAKEAFGDVSWPQVREIYRNVYTPLIKGVVPDMETAGMWDREGRVLLHPYYDIAGQANGRLLCSKPLRRCYNPHVIMPEERLRFQPRQGESFIYLDFKHMEISMLQWLSKDDRLAQIMAADEDLYRIFFKLVSGGICDSDKKRDMAKNFLLPIIYGQAAPGLAHSLGISELTAEKIIAKVYNLIPTALRWVESQRVNDRNECRDIFGRRRVFEDRHHRVRDFVVQSPASLNCLEKLVQLHKALAGYGRIACHIHDGYLLYAASGQVKTVANLAKTVLEGDSGLCPGLRLKVTCTTGRSLAELQEIKGN